METRRILMRSLAVAVIIASVIWTTTAQDKENQKLKSCCTKVSTAKVTDPIIGVRLQRESLPCVKAVILETEQGEFCCDPKQQWVREKVKRFFISKKQTPRHHQHHLLVTELVWEDPPKQLSAYHES